MEMTPWWKIILSGYVGYQEYFYGVWLGDYDCTTRTMSCSCVDGVMVIVEARVDVK